jgi:ribonucleoside-diphosphate reductase alpha chain
MMLERTPLRQQDELSLLGKRIFFDRYAMKATPGSTLKVGDVVLGALPNAVRQRAVAEVTVVEGDIANVVFDDSSEAKLALRDLEQVIELSPAQLWNRIAAAAAQAETPELRSHWGNIFRSILEDWKFVPGGRILAGAGLGRACMNCYVLPSPTDSRSGILSTLHQMTELMANGGGVGINISSLRPRNSRILSNGGRSSGAVSWGDLYGFVTGLVEQGGTRRGALMLVMDVWHPDVLEFVSHKTDPRSLTNANISLGITDAFMTAVKENQEWQFEFPVTTHRMYHQEWKGDLAAWKRAGYPTEIYQARPAREIWQRIAQSAWSSGEPGVFFSDRYNEASNSHYYAPISCTNPCAEEGLPAWGACNLGSINLSKFANACSVDWEALRATVHGAVRFLDNIIDISTYPFEENRRQQISERRVGLGTLGLAELLIQLGIRYGTAECVAVVDEIFKFVANESYLASAELAREKGTFPRYDREQFLRGKFLAKLDPHVREHIASHGIRNVSILSQAPTGTIGTMIGTTTGIEPYYSFEWTRSSWLGEHSENVPLVTEWQSSHPNEPLPIHFVTAMQLRPEEHVTVQAAAQNWIDASVSKTCNVPAHYTVDDVARIFDLLYSLGCKGGTIYRDGSRPTQVLKPTDTLVCSVCE